VASRTEISLIDRQHDDDAARVPEPGGPLPRGRHSLPPEVVEANQRQRVAAAASRLLAEQGYASLTVERLQQAAGISRSTFYVHFANKREAVLAAYDLAFERFSSSLAEASLAEPDRPRRVRAAIATALDLAAAEPEQAQLLSGFALCADPELTRRVFDYHDRLALLLCDSKGTGVPDVSGQALVGAVTSILARHLIAGDREVLRDLEVQLVRLALSPYLGPEEAALAADGTR
jgi:AcrR family transcriptional regulator